MKQYIAIAMLAASAAANSQTFEGVPLAPNQQAPLGQQYYQQVPLESRTGFGYAIIYLYSIFTFKNSFCMDTSKWLNRWEVVQSNNLYAGHIIIILGSGIKAKQHEGGGDSN